MSNHFSNNTPQCILCGRCLEVCPLFQITGHEELSPRGKAFLIQNLTHQELSPKEASQLAGLCTGCRKCTRICPQGIDLPPRIARLKAGHPHWKAWIWSRILKNRKFFLPLMRLSGSVAPNSFSLLNLFRASYRQSLAMFRLVSSPAHKAQKAVLFPGCLGRFLRPDLTTRAGNILTSLGFEVLTTPNWECCGFPLEQAGLVEEAALCREKNLEIWQKLNRPLVYTFCATCLEALAGTSPQARLSSGQDELGSQTAELSSLIPELPLKQVSRAKNPDLVWHEPCHGTQRTGAILQRTLSAYGKRLTLHQGNCCGLGGSFRIQSPQLSVQMAQALWQKLSPQENSICLTECSGCLIQLASTHPPGTGVAHWLELLERESN